MKNIGVFVVFSNDSLSTAKNLHKYCKFWLYCESYVIVNTKTEIAYLTDSEMCIIDSYVIRGVNSEWEFSGYKCGFKIAKELIKNENSYRVVFLNDTLITHSRFRKCELIALSENCIGNSLKKPTLTGFYHKTCFLKNADSYANTKFFIVENIPFDIVDDAFAIDEIKVEITPDGNYLNNFYIDQSYNVFLRSWLNGEVKGVGLIKPWYKAEKINSSNSDFFKNKARSIIHEHVFTARLLENDVQSKCLMKHSYLIKILQLFTGFKY